ncbi:hypothetical protein [Pseudonocardia sp. NPDC049635]|uniref:hypothetical protein n=1 Tax=Pseudonocardia sp. NPDC049635 TaxID=3155506 RepID=UPI0033FC2AD7
MARAHKISHTEFLRWPLYDRQKAVAYEIRLSEYCPDCGTHPDTWDPAKGGHPHAMEMRLEHCRGCEITEQHDKAIENKRDQVPAGGKWRLRAAREAQSDGSGDRVDEGRGPGEVQGPGPPAA